jgi:tetratricopeptide (TPR) repeat protein
VLSQTPNNPDLLTMLARMDLRAGRAAQALDRLNQAVATGRVQPKVLLERARVLAVRGDVEAAQQDALRAFEAQPSLDGASALLLRLYAAQGRTEEAIASFEEANAAGALAPPARLLLARLHMSRGNDKRARELFEGLLAENNDIPGVKNDLAYLLARENSDLDRALRLAQEAQRGLTRSPNVSDTLGYVYLRKGLFEPALEQFRYAMTQAKQGGLDVLPVFHYHAGLALRELGRLDEAVDEFEQALAIDASFEDAADALRAAKAAQVEEGGEPAPAPSPS